MAELSQVRVSVVIPVLNNASSLAVTLRSVFSQNYPNTELIVIDGGSSDGTLDVINDFSSQIFYWETGKDSGISDAFNRGVQHATGELITILNSDDSWVADTLNLVLASYAKNEDADVYYGQVLYSDPITLKSYIRSPDLSRMKERMYLFHPAVFVKRSSYDQIGFYSSEYKLAMDAEWLHRAIVGGLKFQAVDSVLANMSLGGRSDRNFILALWEYRKSLLENRLSGVWEANYYFAKFAFLKTIMRITWLRSLKQQVLK